MRNFVITIQDTPQSVEAAKRCIKSGKRWQTDIEMFDAITPRNTDVKQKLADLEFPIKNFGEKYSRLNNCIAAFLSHYTLWNKCIELGEEIHIFEHDAVLMDYLPTTLQYSGAISLGKPSYGNFKTPNILGVNRLMSKQYFPGAHAYRLTPTASKVLVDKAKEDAGPTDVYLDVRRFPFLQEYYPWPVEVKENFSTIQKVAGCWAKHGFDNEYKII